MANRIQRKLGQRLGGVLTGTLNVANGHLKRISPFGGQVRGIQASLDGHLSKIRKKGGKTRGPILGKIYGPKNVESGQIYAIATKQSLSAGGRKGSHTRLALETNIVDPTCTFCQEAANGKS